MREEAEEKHDLCGACRLLEQLRWRNEGGASRDRLENSNFLSTRPSILALKVVRKNPKKLLVASM